MEDASQEQELFNEFKSTVRSFIRATKKYLRNGGSLTDVEINTAFDRLFITFANDLDDLESLQAVKWINRAEKFLENEQFKLIEEGEFSEIIDKADESGEYVIDTSEGSITINGIEYVLFRQSDTPIFDRLGIKRRGRTITSLSELAEYVEAIPAVAAIEIVYDVNGVIKGYRVWVSPRTL